MQLNALSDKLIQDGTITQSLNVLRSVGGGCINDCFQVQSGTELFFLKVNSASAYPGMFEKEASGLKLLHESNTLDVPLAIGEYEVNGTAYLLMDFIEPSGRTDDYWESCGRQLAKLHRNTVEQFGLDHDNYIGSLHQKNDFRQSWAEFYLECRMVPQLQMGTKSGWTDSSVFAYADRIAQVIDNEFPEEPPSLLHGDLWSGNLMTGSKGQAVIVDPAVYYGNREVEMTFTKLFGGFNPSFYEAYNTEWPLQEDFQKRMAVHNLYPLMVHANLFGGHYVQEVMSILKRFG